MPVQYIGTPETGFDRALKAVGLLKEIQNDTIRLQLQSKALDMRQSELILDNQLKQQQLDFAQMYGGDEAKLEMQMRQANLDLVKSQAAENWSQAVGGASTKIGNAVSSLVDVFNPSPEKIRAQESARQLKRINDQEEKNLTAFEENLPTARKYVEDSLVKNRGYTREQAAQLARLKGEEFKTLYGQVTQENKEIAVANVRQQNENNETQRAQMHRQAMSAIATFDKDPATAVMIVKSSAKYVPELEELVPVLEERAARAIANPKVSNKDLELIAWQSALKAAERKGDRAGINAALGAMLRISGMKAEETITYGPGGVTKTVDPSGVTTVTDDYLEARRQQQQQNTPSATTAPAAQPGVKPVTFVRTQQEAVELIRSGTLRPGDQIQVAGEPRPRTVK